VSPSDPVGPCAEHSVTQASASGFSAAHFRPMRVLRAEIDRELVEGPQRVLRVLWRDADTEVRDLKSNALIADQCAIDFLVVEGSWQRCSESVGLSAPRLVRRPSHKCYFRAARRLRGPRPAYSSALGWRSRQGRSPQGRTKREP
jgi:hypothetical protein